MKNSVQDARERVEQWSRAVETAPGSAAAHFNLGTALLDLGLATRAEEEFRRALDLRPGFPEALVNLGGILLSRLDFHGCIDANRKAREAKPDLLTAHYGEGLGHLYLGEAKPMVECFRRALGVDRRHAPSHYHLAVGLLALGELAESEVHLEAALEGGFSPAPGFLRELQKARGGPVPALEFNPKTGSGAPTTARHQEE